MEGSQRVATREREAVHSGLETQGGQELFFLQDRGDLLCIEKRKSLTG